ncbi:MAG: UDP-glucose 4-epimerase GalE [Patescibacteria group bacterium]|nr:UDP-glucose 4-epimerase GalE [Patescibacteria group bacterium]
MSKILLTGGAGYIGSHLAVELLEKNYEVVIIDNLSNSTTETINRIEKLSGRRSEFYKFDLCDSDELKKFFAKQNDINGVIHLAAFKAVGESVKKPLDYYRNNLLSLENLLTYVLEKKINNFIFSSSAAVYGEPEELPLKETSPIKQPTSPYGNTKKIGEEILKDVAAVNPGFNCVVLRYFNAAGAHDSGLIGELPKGVPENLVPFITQTGAGAREELKVFGDDYNTPDGTCVRDYIHVVDLAKAHIKALERSADGKNKNNFEVFNIGTGQGASVTQAIKAFEKASGKKLKYKIVGRRPGDPATVFTATDLAKKELGWQAEKNLDEILASAWKWEKNLRGIK